MTFYTVVQEIGEHNNLDETVNVQENCFCGNISKCNKL